MSVLSWLLEQLQHGFDYLVGLTDQVVANVIAAGTVLVLGAVWAWLLVRVFRRKRKAEEDEKFDEKFLRRQRAVMLDTIERQWVQGRLERSLHCQAPVFLGVAETPEAVERPWEYEIQMPGQAPRRTSDTGAILEVYDEACSLLILGAPGSGKTVTLLDLARQLIERARRDAEEPLPVVFVLASWARQKKPLDEWMISELERQYRVPPALGRYWLKRNELLPLLDGLDEVEDSARAACVKAINAFRSGVVGGAAVVVCSREAEYAQLGQRLQVERAVVLQPLGDRQVMQYLKRLGKRAKLLTAMLAENEQLRGFAHVPLWLDVMTVAYAADAAATAPTTATTADIFDAFILRVLLQHRIPLREWSAKQCLRWLVWLARQMERTNQILFRMDEMQPDWLGGEAKQRRYRWWLWCATTAVVGLVEGLMVGLLSGRVSGLVLGLASGLVLGSVVALDIHPTDKADKHFIAPVSGWAWNWPAAVRGLARGLVGGLVLALVEFLVIALYEAVFVGPVVVPVGALVALLLGALAVALGAGLASGLLSGLKSRSAIGPQTRPNRGMWQSAQSGLGIGLGVGLPLGVGTGLFGGLLGGLGSGLGLGFGMGLGAGLAAGLGTPGGQAAVRLAVLRWRMWREGLTPKPWRYVPFLDAMTGRLLLDRIGGAYRFKHDLLQQHIARLDDKFIATVDDAHVSAPGGVGSA